MTWLRCALLGATVALFAFLAMDGAAYGTGWKAGWEERQQAYEREAR